MWVRSAGASCLGSEWEARAPILSLIPRREDERGLVPALWAGVLLYCVSVGGAGQGSIGDTMGRVLRLLNC